MKCTSLRCFTNLEECDSAVIDAGGHIFCHSCIESNKSLICVKCNSLVCIGDQRIYLCSSNRVLTKEEKSQDILSSNDTLPSQKIETVERLKAIAEIVRKFSRNDAAANRRKELASHRHDVKLLNLSLENRLEEAHMQLEQVKSVRNDLYKASLHSRTVVQWSNWRVEELQRQLDWQATTSERLGIPNKRQNKPRPAAFRDIPNRNKEVSILDPLEGFGVAFSAMETRSWTFPI
ncbi:hypothetical protein BD410DRAFT_805266 [Rickenella mellea]|uniref:Uncharacterized protein n=1 Tax=Rickenella mellea TaxID=50990 RepID=A0A4Y7PX68_9AGAM|nr:hypothetical protein BD410DRAFT_805266 [Rickenella mellea]